MKKIGKTIVALGLCAGIALGGAGDVHAGTVSYTSGNYTYSLIYSNVTTASNVKRITTPEYHKKVANDTRTDLTLTYSKGRTTTSSMSGSIACTVDMLVTKVEGTVGFSEAISQTETETHTAFVYRNDPTGYYYYESYTVGKGLKLQGKKTNIKSGKTTDVSAWNQTISFAPLRGGKIALRRGYSKSYPS